MPTQPPGLCCCTFFSVMAKFFTVESFISATLQNHHRQLQKNQKNQKNRKSKTTFLNQQRVPLYIVKTNKHIQFSAHIFSFTDQKKKKKNLTFPWMIPSPTKQKKKGKGNSFLFPLGTHLQKLSLTLMETTYNNVIQKRHGNKSAKLDSSRTKAESNSWYSKTTPSKKKQRTIQLLHSNVSKSQASTNNAANAICSKTTTARCKAKLRWRRACG